MNTVYLLLGGNIGDRLFYLRQAKEAIAETTGKIPETSSVYETKAWGMEEQPSFYNCILKIETPLEAEPLLQQLLSIEKIIGRVRTGNSRWRERVIDIDILFFNNEVLSNEQLVIPHPQLHRRRFTLAPLEEIAPYLVHPVLGKSIRELLLACPDKLDVKKLPDAL